MNMMTSLNVNIFRVTGHLLEESSGYLWIPLTKSSDAELWYFLWYVLEQTVEQTFDTLVILVTGGLSSEGVNKARSISI